MGPRGVPWRDGELSVGGGVDPPANVTVVAADEASIPEAKSKMVGRGESSSHVIVVGTNVLSGRGVDLTICGVVRANLTSGTGGCGKVLAGRTGG